MSNVSLLGGCLPINTSSATVEEATTSHLWMIGVVLMLIGCASSATGLLFMKQSSVMGEGKKPLCRRWRWITGFVLLVVNAIWIDIIAFSITPMALIAPFAGMTIVFTLLISATGCVTKREAPLGR